MQKTGATVNDIIEIMNEIAPPKLAESWDNPGLQVGDRGWAAKKVRIALDPLLEVVERACRDKVDMLVTHHPLLFRPLKQLDFSTPAGKIVRMALESKLAVFSAHTNLDSAQGGLNDYLSELMGLRDLKPLQVSQGPEMCKLVVFVPSEIQGEAIACDVYRLSSTESSGLGRVGELHSPVSLREFAFQVKEKLGLSYVRVAGDPELAVARVAVCSGSGSGLLKSFFSSNAQVYVSGDLHYHDARDVEASGRGLVDIGHFGSERIVGDLLVDRLQRAFDRKGMDAVAEACELETDPFILV